MKPELEIFLSKVLDHAQGLDRIEDKIDLISLVAQTSSAARELDDLQTGIKDHETNAHHTLEDLKATIRANRRGIGQVCRQTGSS